VRIELKEFHIAFLCGKTTIMATTLHNAVVYFEGLYPKTKILFVTDTKFYKLTKQFQP